MLTTHRATKVGCVSINRKMLLGQVLVFIVKLISSCQGSKSLSQYSTRSQIQMVTMVYLSLMLMSVDFPCLRKCRRFFLHGIFAVKEMSQISLYKIFICAFSLFNFLSNYFCYILSL